MGDKNNSSAAGAKRVRAPHGSTVAERLAFFSIPEPNSGCYLWLGRVDTNGRPTLNINGKTTRANRAALELKLGRPLLPGMFACHDCDVPLCINEDHLFEGTHLDNMADMRAKGRQPRGERGSLVKLTQAQVVAIITDPREPYSLIGNDYGIDRRTVSDIKLGKRWAHLVRQS
jgi:hypothetical protein